MRTLLSLLTYFFGRDIAAYFMSFLKYARKKPPINDKAWIVGDTNWHKTNDYTIGWYHYVDIDGWFKIHYTRTYKNAYSGGMNYGQILNARLNTIEIKKYFDRKQMINESLQVVNEEGWA